MSSIRMSGIVLGGLGHLTNLDISRYITSGDKVGL